MKGTRMSLARGALLLALGILLLSPSARADIGPKPSLTVRVLHAPEGTCYVDLLTQGEPREDPYPNSDEPDPAILANLRSLEGDGWVLAYSTGLKNRPPVFGRLTPDEAGIWHFSYSGLPETFRVAFATAEGAQVSDTVYTRRFTDNIIYDLESNTVRAATPYPLYFTLQVLSTLVPTLLIEGVLLWVFGFRQRRTWAVFLAVNLITQIGLHLACGSLLFTAGAHPIFYVLILLFPELIIWTVEAAAYAFLFREASKGRRIGYALCANLVSFIFGFFPLYLLFPWIGTL